MRLFVILFGMVISCQAVFKPTTNDELRDAIGSNDRLEDGRVGCGNNKIPTHGCLGESVDGDCPIFAASNDGTGNPHGVVGDWDVSQVTDLNNILHHCKEFNRDISKWEVSRVTNLHKAFDSAWSFNSDVSGWDVSSVTTLAHTFHHAKVFNSDLSKWDVSSVTSLSYTFRLADVFNSDLSKWDVSSVTSLEKTFASYGSYNVELAFNSDISSWDVSRVITMKEIFKDTSMFKGDLSRWNIDNVIDMYNWVGGVDPYTTSISQCSMSPIDSNIPNVQQPFKGCEICPTEDCGNSMVCKRSTDNNIVNPHSGVPSFKCNCDTGSYKNIDWASGPNVAFDPYTPPCVECPLGTYQNVAGQLSCETCPPGRSTTVLGSTLETDCLTATQIKQKFLDTRQPALVPAYNIANSCTE
jgi:surface protein